MDKNKVPTIEELQQQISNLETEKNQEIENLKKMLDEEKRKNMQFSIAGLTKKVEPLHKEEPVDFDFDM